MLPNPTNAIDFMPRTPRAAHRDARACTSRGTNAPDATAASLQRRIGSGHSVSRASGASSFACYNRAPRMLGWHWAVLVAGTLLGVVSLTADLVGVGAFP